MPSHGKKNTKHAEDLELLILTTAMHNFSLPQALHLEADLRVYHYINQSSCYERRDGVMDSDLWAELNKAMQVWGTYKMHVVGGW